MAKLNVPPTKSSYLGINQQLAFAEEGFELLEQKRQILVLELMGRVELARRVQAEIEELLRAAREALREAAVGAGTAQLVGESAGVRVTHRIRLESHNVVGLALPVVTSESDEPGAQFGLGRGTSKSDEVMKRFLEVLKRIGKLAEVENAVVRLAREVRRTQRRVNALEKIFIPDYRETQQYILEALEEREREGFVIMKMLKKRRGR